MANWATQLIAAGQALATPLLPPACALCREPVSTRGVLCPSCWREIAFLNGEGCTRCGRPVLAPAGEPDLVCDGCLRTDPPWDRGRAVMAYDQGGRRLVLSLKHGDRVDTLPLLGGWMARAGADILAQADIAAPVPLHWQRRLKRRFNQAAGLAQAACRVAGRPGIFRPRTLIRVKNTASQGHKDRATRALNIDRAFRPGPGAAALSSKRVVLVDDVMTTGATLAECARTCLAAGARSVDVLVLALVVPEETSYIPSATEDEDHEHC